jgi:hypothetical protein
MVKDSQVAVICGGGGSEGLPGPGNSAPILHPFTWSGAGGGFSQPGVVSARNNFHGQQLTVFQVQIMYDDKRLPILEIIILWLQPTLSSPMLSAAAWNEMKPKQNSKKIDKI